MAAAAKQQQQTTKTTVLDGGSSSIKKSTTSSIIESSSLISTSTSSVSKTTLQQTSRILSSRSSNFEQSTSPLLNHINSSDTISNSSGNFSKSSSSSSSSISFVDAADEDIATIAKKISDHAEAIYQTWKARGLAPTEILNCHTDTSGDVLFNKVLAPSSAIHTIDKSITKSSDMSNNSNLGKFVSSFINEDKARQQHGSKNINMTQSSPGGGSTSNMNRINNDNETNDSSGGIILTSCTIKDALRKFENSSNTTSGYVKPNFLIKNSNIKSTNEFQKRQINSSNQSLKSKSFTSHSPLSSSSLVSAAISSPSSSSSIPSSTTTKLSQSVPDVLIDSINQTTKHMPINSKKNISSNPVLTSSATILSSLTKPSSSSSSPIVNISETSTSSTSSSLFYDSKNLRSNNSIINSSSDLSDSSTISSSSSTTSNIKKPQTPAKPANLLNHTPVWPLKNRLNIGSTINSSSSGSGNIGGSNIGGTTSSTNTNITKSNLIANTIESDSNTTMNKNGSKDTTDSITNSKINLIKSIEFERKSADLLDEVSREEERLINALKTGIVINNSNDKSKLPEVITSTLNDNNKSDHYNRTSTWIKKSSKPSQNQQQLQQHKSVVANSKVASVPSSSVIKTVTANNISSISTTSSISSNTAPPSEDQQFSRSGSSAVSWNNDDLANKTVTVTPLDTSTVTTVGTSTVTTTTPTSSQISSSSLLIRTSTSETMSPAPTPIPTKLKIRPKNDAAVPHPDTKNSNLHNQNNYSNNRINFSTPVRPFLTRGSVAERVLMFEKCPDVKASLRNINRTETAKPSKSLVKPVSKQPIEESTPPPHTTLQRHIRSSSAKTVYIPKFYFPHGKPLPTITLETTLQRLKSAFDSFPNNQVTKENFHHILKICGLPFYWRMPLIECTQHPTSRLVDGYRFIEFWKGMSVYCHDQYSRFVYILSRGQRSRPYILHEDLASLVQDVVDTHPGLAFLKEASEFHSRYVHTVIARIFYSVNRSWSGKITIPELKRSNLLQVIQLLEEEEDINQIMAFFSYEHFYVIYCKFWELDRDHDLFIDQDDLQRHNDHSLSLRIIERIFSGCVTRGIRSSNINDANGPKMSYTDFVWFLLSEEDKTHPTAIEYWFRCMDIDGDGVISMYELEYFYEEQQQRIEALGIEALSFEDCLCQMLDMIKPVKPGCITLSDLKRCRMTPIFFDTFFNLEKYLDHEQRDPFATQRENDDGMTDWDRYAAQEYELLVAEEGGDTQGSYDEDDDYESEDVSNLMNEW